MLSACGITAKSLELLLLSYDNNISNISKEVAISADIKTIPDDFVVVEVDTDGQRTDDIAHYMFTKESKADTDVKSTNSKVAKTLTEKEEQCNRSITWRHEDIINNIKTIVDEHKTEVECAVGSTNDILHKANAMTLYEIQELLQEIMPHSQSTFALYDNNNNYKSNTIIDIVCNSEKWWNKTTEFTFPLEDIVGVATRNDGIHNSCITTYNSDNTKIHKEIRRMFYTIMRQRFPLLRTHLIESINDGDTNTNSSNNTTSSSIDTLESVAEMSALQNQKEEHASWVEDCEEQKTTKQPQVTVKVSVIVDLHLIYVTWLCGQDVALWLSSCINSESFESSSLDIIGSGNSDNANQGKRANTIAFTFRDVDRYSGDNVTMTSKEVRRNFHNILRRYYSYIQCKVRNGRVELQLVSQSRKRCRSNSERVGNANLFKNHPSNDHNQYELSNNVNKYAYLIVKKENMETAEMKMVLAGYFGIHEHYICTAGLKDKVAITYQRCSIPLYVKVCNNNINNNNTYISVEDTLTQIVKGTLPFAIPLSSSSISSATCNECKKCEIVKCSFPSVVYTSPIEIGDLHGNYFKIVLRNVEMRETDHSIAKNECDNIVTCADNNNLNIIERLQSILSERARYLTEYGFINYFGQQRFSESVEELHDHTGILLLAEEYVKAVQSLFRSCTHVYMHFPETMDKRHVPQHARDAQVMAHTLRQTHKMYFSEFDLTSHDVQSESKIWQAICHKAITEATPFALRTMWVHAAQSLLFNLQASFVAAHLTENKDVNGELAQNLARLKLRIPGFVNQGTVITSDTNLASCNVCKIAEEKVQPQKENDARGEELELEHKEAFTSIQEKALTYALEQVGLNELQVFSKRKVANVPFHAGWRHFLALPRDVQISVTAIEGKAQNNINNINENSISVTVSMYLPSSTYATIFLRELLNYDKWW